MAWASTIPGATASAYGASEMPARRATAAAGDWSAGCRGHYCPVMNDVTRATAAIIGDPEGRVLLVQQNHGHRRWGLPGAHIDPEELPDEAVVREIRKETGLET